MGGEHSSTKTQIGPPVVRLSRMDQAGFAQAPPQRVANVLCQKPH